MRVQDWGLVPYLEATSRQLALVDSLSRGQEGDQIVLCQHPPVVTMGRLTPKEDVFSWDGEIHESSRGGRATYHGPHQMVVYLILDLKKENRQHLRSRDIHSLLRNVEVATIHLLESLGLKGCERRIADLKDEKGRALITTGVWRGERKIASVGMAVKKWISYHGVAINLYEDPGAYRGIHPCGFSRGLMTSFEFETGEKISMGAAKDLAGRIFGEHFE